MPDSTLIPRGVYLRWGGQRNRADDVAALLGVPLVSLAWKTRRPWLVPLRYAIQFAQTLVVLWRRRPEVVLSHHTQPFCSLAAWLYTRWHGARLVTDCHNGTLVDSPWNRWPVSAINRFVFARAAVNLVHNHAIAEHVPRHAPHARALLGSAGSTRQKRGRALSARRRVSWPRARDLFVGG